MATNLAVQRAADEVRAEMARQRRTISDLTRGVGKSASYWSRRLSGEVPLDVADLAAIAAYLHVGTAAFLPPERASA